MTDVIETADALHTTANHLYWTSTDTVDALAARLGMSRHALYSSIRPAPAGQDCDCGAELVFANRNARAAGKAECAQCGAERNLPVDGTPLPADPPPPLDEHRIRPALRDVVRHAWREVSRVPRDRAAKVGAAAALGITAALAAGEAFRHLHRW